MLSPLRLRLKATSISTASRESHAGNDQNAASSHEAKA